MPFSASFMFRFTLSNDSQFLLNPNGISSHSPGLRQRRYPGNDFTGSTGFCGSINASEQDENIFEFSAINRDSAGPLP
jgi:hypothetical protein